LGADPAKPEALQAGLTSAARSNLDHALSLSLLEPPAPFDAALDTPKPQRRQRFPRHPRDPRCRPAAARCPSRMTWSCTFMLPRGHGSRLRAFGIDGALVIYNLGLGSGAYEDPYSIPNSYDHMLESVRLAVRELCRARPRPKRVALSG